MINTETNEFIQALVKLINESNLPPVNVRMAMELVHNHIVEAEQAAMAEEQATEQKENKTAMEG